ncbi:unnamed protein product [Adineta steineri]|uniref:Uncharacterized protein n=1 Tax=Adineta steineri TaxID=433720 RepID=A0A814DKI3_9BILA|nr:unnamed protein product [Adineta steineri]CAF3497749.1 unnamed protein product [Adineta steineri]
MIRTIVRCLTTKVSLNPKPLAPNKPKASIDFDNEFQDEIEIRLIAGKGGDGRSSFSKTFQNEFGGPNGGDGGNGAHIILQASKHLTSLNNIRKMYIADNGEPGEANFKKGKSAEHLTVQVPVGTIVKKMNGNMACELVKHEQKFIAARGGLGGKGNYYFLSNMNRAPTECELGASGDKKKYKLELQLIAHFGLLGFPNAGKSSLLRTISRARPIVGDYEFTTRQLQLGTIEYDDFIQIHVADVPGIVPGASKQDQGLGSQFLRHIERCLALLLIIDMSVERPWEQYDLLMNELHDYKMDLTKKPITVIGNKMDDHDAKRQFDQTRQYIPYPLLPISTIEKINIDKLMLYLRKQYDELITDEWRERIN